MHAYKYARLGGSGGLLPQEIILKLGALRLLLRPFWDKSRAVVPIHGPQSIASSFWLPYILTLAKPADIEFP